MPSLGLSRFSALLLQALLVCLLCFFTSPHTFAQKRQKARKSKPTAAAVQQAQVAQQATIQPDIDPEKFKNAHAVLGRLLKALGDNRLPAPKLSMSKDTNRAVWVDFAQMEIGIEEKAYQTAHALMGDTTLAFLLAAPVMYYYDGGRNNESARPATDLLKSGFGPDSMSFYQGGFLSYSAGYGIFEKGPELLAALYKAYGLPDDAKLAGRKLGVQQAGQKLLVLVEVFETGALLSATGVYPDAYAYYRFVLKDFQNKETLNNAGVSAILNALRYFRPNEREARFRFPFQLDIESKSARDVGDFTVIRSRLLRQAVDHFVAAIRMDSTYATARLNLAGAYALLGDVQKADSLIQRAVSLSLSEKTALDLQVLRGILYEWKGDKAKAEKEFKAAADKNSNSAQFNLDALFGRTPKAAVSTDFSSVVEKIDGWDLMDPGNLPEYVPASEIRVDDQIRFYHNRRPGPNSRFYLSHNAGSGRYSYFLLTGPGYAGETGRGMKAGATRDAIVAAYGKPPHSIEAPSGEILIYNTILMILGPGGKLERWVLRGEVEE